MNELKDVIEVRRAIGDPVTADFICVNELPPTALENVAHTTGAGGYWYFDGLDWRLYELKFSDGYIGGLVEGLGKLKASLKLIDSLIAQIDPMSYLSSGNAGGQSLSFPSLQEVLDYYNSLRNRLLEEEAAEQGLNSGRMLNTRRRAVGGVQEDDE